MGRLGPFELIHEAGHGAMATVWYGRHIDSGTSVAVKTLLRSSRFDGSNLPRYREEVRAAARIVHPGVVRIFDVGTVDTDATATGLGGGYEGSPYIVMEWAPYGNLGDRANELRWPALRRILESLLDALSAAHARGVVHRDVKPANILFADRGLVLADFGVAFIGDSDEGIRSKSRIVGSPNYMAPEQILGWWRDFGPPTDLYSVGCMAWSIITGRPPYKRANPRETLVAHLRDKLGVFEPRFSVPHAVEGWCRRLMAKHIQNRFQCAADALCALSAIDPAETVDSGAVTQPISRFLAPTDDTIVSPPMNVDLTYEGMSSGTRQRPGVAIPRHWSRQNEQAVESALVGVGQKVFASASAPFVGREKQRDALWRLLREIEVDSVPKVAVVSGEAGAGKTSLINWFTCRAHEVGAAEHLFIGHQRGRDDIEAFQGMVCRLLRTEHLEGTERFARIVSVLRRWGSTLNPTEIDAFLNAGQRSVANGEAIYLSSSAERFAVLLSLMRDLCRRKTLIVVVDDIQWSNATSSWLQYMLRHGSDLPIFWLLGFRTSDVHALSTNPFESLLDWGHAQGMHFALEPLDAEEARHLIQTRIRLSPQTLSRLLEQVQGNPLFAEQVVRHWIETGRLRRGARGYWVSERDAIDVPDGIQSLWRARIALYAEHAGAKRIEALKVAAALGVEFAVEEWCDVCADLGIEANRHVLEQLERFELCVPKDVTSHRFVHGLLTDTVIQMCRESGHWEALNVACANVLRKRPSVSRGRVGHHAMLGNEFALAEDSFRHAAEKLWNIGELKASGQMRIRQGLALRKLGVGRRDIRWASIRSQWSGCQRVQGNMKASLRHADHAIALLPNADQSTIRALCILQKAMVSRFHLGHDVAVALFEAAYASATASGDVPTMVSCGRLLAINARNIGDYERARFVFDEVKDAVEKGGLGQVESPLKETTTIELMLSHAQQCAVDDDLEKALTLLRQAEELARALGNRQRQSTVLSTKARLLFDEGRWDDALVSFAASSAIFKQLNHSDYFTNLAYYGIIDIERGRYAMGLTKLEESVNALETFGRHNTARLVKMSALGALAREGRWSEWLERFRVLEGMVSEGQLAPSFARMIAFSVRHLVELKEFETAAALVNVLLAVYEDYPKDECFDEYKELLHSIPSKH